jgi:hypothetical protein
MMEIYADMPGYSAGANDISLDYNIIGALDAANRPLDYAFVRAALCAFAPVSNAPPGSVYAWPRRGLDLKESGWGTWKAKITWAALNYQYAVKIAGQQQHIRASRETVHKYGTNPPDTHQAIEWDGHSVHGCSIYVPTKTWTETVEIPAAEYSFDYEDQVETLMFAPVNGAPFRGKPKGSVLFLGMNASMSTQNPDFVQAAYEFCFTPNNSVAGGNALTIGSVTNIEKEGWQYLWVYYAPTVDATAKAMAPKALNVFVEQVYNYGDFAALNIGTGKTLPLWQG